MPSLNNATKWSFYYICRYTPQFIHTIYRYNPQFYTAIYSYPHSDFNNRSKVSINTFKVK